MRSLLAVTIVASLACATGSTASGDASEIQTDEAFQLTVGEEAGLTDERLMIRFVGVSVDSRCPTGVNCFWAGDAAIDLTVGRGDEERSVTLHTHGGEEYPRRAQVFGHEIHLEELAPYPSSKGKIAPEDYVATLLLRNVS